MLLDFGLHASVLVTFSLCVGGGGGDWIKVQKATN